MKLKIRREIWIGVIITVVGGSILLGAEYFLFYPDEEPVEKTEVVITQGKDYGPKLKQPDTEIYSCIQIVDGKAKVKHPQSIETARQEAIADAKNKALEASRRYLTYRLRANDEHSITDKELFWTDPDQIEILEKEDLGVDADNFYQVKIKADVIYEMEYEARNRLRLNMTAPLTVSIWTSKRNYKNREKFEIYVQGNQDFYAQIFNISSTGEIIQLLPNLYRNMSHFKAGKIYSIPGIEDKFDLEVSPPFGIEKLAIYASDLPLGSIQLQPLEQGLQLYDGTAEELGFKSRSVRVRTRDSHFTDGVQFYEAAWEIKTEG